MNHQSDFGYSTGAISMRCIACGSMELNCCDGTMPQIAGYAAEYPSHAGLLCYGYGETKDAAWREVRSQIMGASASMQRAILPRVKLRPLSADEASEVCEMIATPW